MATKSRRLCVMSPHPSEFSQQPTIDSGALPSGCVQQTAADLALTFAWVSIRRGGCALQTCLKPLEDVICETKQISGLIQRWITSG